LHLNLSHSVECALIAFSNKPVGVDIEHINENHNFTSFLSIFNSSEASFIENAVNKKHAFYSLWTRKEAFVKAIGIGIDDNFPTVPCMDGTHLLDFYFSHPKKNWSIEGFQLTNNYIAAIAYEIINNHYGKILTYRLPKKIKFLYQDYDNS